ncbi:MAG: hypothetical protein QF362_02160 [Candidatus Woesearchaeota archaeon]|jgi:hypothetical protein|nr:hypothetical protein [Candidatus Woesearchaeota archaeon]
MANKTLLAVIGVVLIVIVGIIIAKLSGRTGPPTIRFIDGRTSLSLSGEVYLDDKYMGEVEKGFFDKMPESYCSGKHTITLKSLEYELKWETLPSDCSYSLVTLDYGEATE